MQNEITELCNPFIAGSGLFGLPPVIFPAIGLVVIYLITKAVRAHRGDTKESDRYEQELDAREQRIKQRERMEQLRSRERELEEREKRLK